MDEPFLPGWLIVLLCLWAAALTFWQNPSVNREIRSWAGLLTLIYLGLIFLVLGNGQRTIGSIAQALLNSGAKTIGCTVCIIISLMAGVGLLGPFRPRRRRMCYIILTVANAVFCWLVQGFEIASALLVYAAIIAWPLLSNVSRAAPEHAQPIAEESNASPAPHEHGEFLLVGGLNVILACLVIGTLAYSLRMETARAITTPRYSSLPSLAVLERNRPTHSNSDRESTLIDLATESRAEIVILLAVIAFLSLALSPRVSSVAPVIAPLSNRDSLPNGKQS